MLLAEHLGQASQPPTAPEVDLPEAVPRGVEALRTEGVVAAGGVDVRDAPPVDDDSRRLCQTRQDEGLLVEVVLPGSDRWSTP